jgi:hypothetical protein
MKGLLLFIRIATLLLNLFPYLAVVVFAKPSSEAFTVWCFQTRSTLKIDKALSRSKETSTRVIHASLPGLVANTMKPDYVNLEVS